MRKKNKLNVMGLWLLAFVLPFLISSCQKNESLKVGSLPGKKAQAAVSTSDLIAYKNSPHALSVGYYSVTGTGWFDIPDSVDIVDNWGGGPFNDTTDFQRIRQIQETKGTRVIHCAWPPNENNTQASYDKWVVDHYNQIILQAGMDGMDLDMEYGLLNQMSTANRVAFMNSVIKYFGKSATVTVPRTGKKPLLVFGTDGSIGTSLLNQFASNVDYVMFQAYSDSPNYWWGSLAKLTTDMGSYNAGNNSKFIAVANGESGSAWKVNTTTGGSRAQIIEYANWCKQNSAGGVGAYHQETDFRNSPPYTFTKQTIQIMNSPTVVGAQGVIFYENSSYGGAASRPLVKGTYTMAQMQALGVPNDWASSVKIPTGWTVTMYPDDNFVGTPWTLSSDNSWFGALSPSANDKLSSIKIQ